MILQRLPHWHRVYKLYVLATAIGIVIHEIAHKGMAKEFGLEIHEVCYFQLGNPAGYVKHEMPRTYGGMFAVSIAPFIFNTGIAYSALVLAGVYYQHLGLETLSVVQLAALFALVWVGIASALHAFPSSHDLNKIWEAAKYLWSQSGVRFLRPLVFLFRHFNVILSLPFLLLLVVLDRFKQLGSSFAFTGLIIWISYQSVVFMTVTNSFWG